VDSTDKDDLSDEMVNAFFDSMDTDGPCLRARACVRACACVCERVRESVDRGTGVLLWSQ
jgi:hypothetical protein